MMKLLACISALLLSFSLHAPAQDTSTATPQDQQKNAAGATPDNTGASSDQTAKPAAPKGTTLIGCLNGPDDDGTYTLRSMAHRMGVQVLGPPGLDKDSGAKVKLTGSWEPLPGPPPPPTKKGAETRRFHATDVEMLAEKCEAPTEVTPVSKQKQQQEKMKQQQQQSNTAGNATNPK